MNVSICVHVWYSAGSCTHIACINTGSLHLVTHQYDVKGPWFVLVIVLWWAPEIGSLHLFVPLSHQRFKRNKCNINGCHTLETHHDLEVIQTEPDAGGIYVQVSNN